MIAHADVTRTDISSIVRDGLERAATVLSAAEIPVPDLEGQLLRPTIAYALVPPDRRAELDDRFWLGALAIQMVHEASLLHDDVLDDASERRGVPTLNSTHGVGPALVKGDHYLTAAYRAALWTRSPDFLERFITSVERTVAGEILQGRGVGAHVGLDTYFTAILGKSGELLRACGALGAAVLGLDRVDERASLGLQIGALYQQVDDLLDYCPNARTGKEALKDYRQQKWTWVLEMAEVESWDLSDEEILGAVFRDRGTGGSAADRALAYLEVRRAALVKTLDELVPGEGLVGSIMDGWLQQVRAAIAAERPPSGSAPRTRTRLSSVGTSRTAESFVVEAASRLGGAESWRSYFAKHARTFSLAARLFPTEERRRVEALYAYCRFTDDLVDGASPTTDTGTLEARLDAWRWMSREAWEGRPSDIPLLDTVMGDAARAGVDWLYPQALLDGVAMDLRPPIYDDWKELSRYTFCVAGAVGGWMTHLMGVHDPDALGRAHALGHAMQLTNILRDVGEDLEMGRIYLPRVLLDAHDLEMEELRTWQASTAPLPERYARAMEELTRRAEERYDQAQPGIRALPTFFRRPVAVAAAAYRGIHDEVRRNGFDNLRRRAHTSTPRKVYLGVRGLIRARAGNTMMLAGEELAT